MKRRKREKRFGIKKVWRLDKAKKDKVAKFGHFKKREKLAKRLLMLNLG